MNRQLILLTLFLSFFASISIAQPPPCQSGPMEGYQGENCNVVSIISNDGFVYTQGQGYAAIKKWSMETGRVVEEWSTEGTGISSIDGFGFNPRYLRVTMKTGGFRLFDTQVGKLIEVGKYTMYHILPGNIAVVYSEKKLQLYDLIAKKVKATIDGDVSWNKVDVSDDGNIIVWSHEDERTVKAYDVKKGSIVLKEKGDIRTFRVSPDGKFIAWCGGMKNLATGKISANACYASNIDLPQMIFTHDNKKLFVMNTGRVYDYGIWHYLVTGLREYDIETGELKADHTEKWYDARIRGAHIPKDLPASPDGNQIYFATEKKIILADKSDYKKQTQVVDFFGSVGTAILAQQKVKTDREMHMLNLTSASALAFEKINVSNVIFRHDVKMANFDYDPDSELALIGNIDETGLFDVNTGKFVATYATDFDREQVGVRAKAKYGFYFIAPGGNLIAQRMEANTFLYNRTAFVKECEGAAFIRFVTARYALAINKSEQIGLYDIDKGSFITTFGKAVINYVALVTPDRSKIIFYNRSRKAEVIEVPSGKVLLKLPEGVWPSAATDNLIFGNNQEIYDITTGEKVTKIKNWDPQRVGRHNRVVGNFNVSMDEKGVTHIFNYKTMDYVSPMPVKLLHEHTFANFAIFPKSNKLLVATTDGSAGFGNAVNATDYASAYTVDIRTGMITPYRYHINGKEAGKIYAAQAEAYRKKREAEDAAANAGLPPCMHNLRVKPNMAVVQKGQTKPSLVIAYDCEKQEYEVQSRLALGNQLTTSSFKVPIWKMEADYLPVRAHICSACNGGGMQTKTVNYSTTNVDNYNANVPGGKVITTKSGSFQQTDFCEACKGAGMIVQP